LCHGDFSPKNLLCHGDRLIFVDHETAHFGDPSMDLGFCLAHLFLKLVKHAPRHEGMLETVRAFVGGYRSAVSYRDPGGLLRECGGRMAVTLLTRIDGPSPVDYLTDEPRRAFVRGVAWKLLLDPGYTVFHVFGEELVSLYDFR